MTDLAHHCHALGCKSKCPPRWLMCRSCWDKVPRDMQNEVYRTVKLRNINSCDATWAPWWRAQAYAIHYLAMLKEPDKEKGARWLNRELSFAESLEKRDKNNE